MVAPLPAITIVIVVVVIPFAVIVAAMPFAAMADQVDVGVLDGGARNERRCRRRGRSNDAGQHGCCERDTDRLHFLLPHLYAREESASALNRH
jgi:hypothetical protein